MFTFALVRERVVVRRALGGEGVGVRPAGCGAADVDGLAGDFGAVGACAMELAIVTPRSFLLQSLLSNLALRSLGSGVRVQPLLAMVLDYFAKSSNRRVSREGSSCMYVYAAESVGRVCVCSTATVMLARWVLSGSGYLATATSEGRHTTVI